MYGSTYVENAPFLQLVSWALWLHPVLLPFQELVWVQHQLLTEIRFPQIDYADGGRFQEGHF